MFCIEWQNTLLWINLLFLLVLSTKAGINSNAFTCWASIYPAHRFDNCTITEQWQSLWCFVLCDLHTYWYNSYYLLDCPTQSIEHHLKYLFNKKYGLRLEKIYHWPFFKSLKKMIKLNQTLLLHIKIGSQIQYCNDKFGWFMDFFMKKCFILP